MVWKGSYKTHPGIRTFHLGEYCDCRLSIIHAPHPSLPFHSPTPTSLHNPFFSHNIFCPHYAWSRPQIPAQGVCPPRTFQSGGGGGVDPKALNPCVYTTWPGLRTQQQRLGSLPALLPPSFSSQQLVFHAPGFPSLWGQQAAIDLSIREEPDQEFGKRRGRGEGVDFLDDGV